MGQYQRDVRFRTMWDYRFRWVWVSIALSLLFPLVAKALSLNWTHELGTAKDDLALGIAIDKNNGVYLTGRTNGNLGGTTFGDYDAWLAKYNSEGALLWKRQLGTSRIDSANAIAVDAKGDIVITGSTEGVFEGVNRGKSDIWVAKYDSQGNFLWKQQFGTQATDNALGVATDSSNQIYLTGYTEGRLTLRGASKPSDAWLAKMDVNGTLLWTKQVGSPGDDYAAAVKVDPTGNIYLCGATSGDFAGDFGGFDGWVAKFNSAGELDWKRQFGTSTDDRAAALDIVNGEVLLAGVTGGNFGGTFAGETDAWVMRYSATGRMIWKKQLGTSEADSASGVASDRGGAIYVTGSTAGAIGSANQGEVDAWIVKYNPRGGLVWKRQIGKKGEDTANAIALDSKDAVYIGGNTQGDSGNAAGLFDAWIAKFLQ